MNKQELESGILGMKSSETHPHEGDLPYPDKINNVLSNGTYTYDKDLTYNEFELLTGDKKKVWTEEEVEHLLKNSIIVKAYTHFGTLKLHFDESYEHGGSTSGIIWINSIFSERYQRKAVESNDLMTINGDNYNPADVSAFYIYKGRNGFTYWTKNGSDVGITGIDISLYQDFFQACIKKGARKCNDYDDTFSYYVSTHDIVMLKG